MYSWADPRYTLVAQAIRRAGLRLFLNMDTGGLISPFVESLHYGRSVFRVERDRWGGPFAGLAVASARLGWQILGLHNHRRRLRHMEASDIIGVVTPIAAERMRKYATRLGRGDLVDRIHFVPHPIDPALRHDGAPKEREVIAVGRWNDPVKRPDLLVAVARELLHRDTTVRVVIVGCDAIWCQARIVAGEPEWVDRVIAFERLDHDALCTRMNRARVSLCTSRSESFHAVSAEALLCGCSIVGPDDPALPALPYYVNEGMSGQLAATAEPANLAQTVLQELAVWERGGRSPHAIADTWHRRVASDSVVTNIDMLLAESRKLSRKT
jgi:glycosyltransferase involved in cell wall biosynthesis